MHSSNHPVNVLSRWQLVHALVVLLVFGTLTVLAGRYVHISFDYLLYHLPAALQFVDRTTFVPHLAMQQVIAGSPPLVHLVQGGLVRIFGDDLTAATLHGPVLLWGLMLVGTMLPAVRQVVALRWLGTALLATPLVVIHLYHGYSDLFAGLLLGAAFLALCIRSKGDSSLGVSLFFAITVFGAALSRFQTWLPCGVFVIGWLVVSWTKVRFTRLLLEVLICVVLVASWPIFNIARFDNPTFPYVAPLIGSRSTSALFSISKEELAGQIPERYLSYVAPRRFLASLFEVNRFVSDAPTYVYTVDMGDPQGSRSVHHRFGGYFIGTVLVLLLVALVSFMQLPWLRAPLLVLGVAIAGISGLAASHELRYWLFIPISAAVVLAIRWQMLPRSTLDLCLQVALLLCCLYVQSTISWWQVFDRTTPRAWKDAAPPHIRRYWRDPALQAGTKETPYLICDHLPYGIFFAGKDANQFHVRERVSWREGCQ